MFFKINALKNFAILRIKKRLQHRCFPVSKKQPLGGALKKDVLFCKLFDVNILIDFLLKMVG